MDNPLVDEATWNGLCRPEPIPDGAEVVLALDGSWGGTDADSTALVLATIGAEPHVDLYRVWENDGTPPWRVPILEVEDAIREACKRWRVKEIAADPFRLGRTLAVLAGEGHRVTEFPFSPSRVTRATTDLHSALVGGKLTHTGDPTLTRHVLSTQVHEDGKGALRIGKANRRRGAAKIDACSALLIAHSRSYVAAPPNRPNESEGRRVLMTNPSLSPQEPEIDPQRLVDLLLALDAVQYQLRRLQTHYDGMAAIEYLVPRRAKAFEGGIAELYVNIPRLVVSSMAERLNVTGFTGADADLAEQIWYANDLDVQGDLAHSEALLFGRSLQHGSGLGATGRASRLSLHDRPLCWPIPAPARSRRR